MLGFNVWWKSTSQDWDESRRLTVPCLVNGPDEEQKQELELTSDIFWCIAVTAFNNQGQETYLSSGPFPNDTPTYMECMWISSDNMRIKEES